MKVHRKAFPIEKRSSLSARSNGRSSDTSKMPVRSCLQRWHYHIFKDTEEIFATYRRMFAAIKRHWDDKMFEEMLILQ